MDGIYAKLALVEVDHLCSSKVQRISTAEGLMEIRQLFPEIDAELNDIAKSLSVLNADYARSLKPLSQAQGDLKALKVLSLLLIYSLQ